MNRIPFIYILYSGQLYGTERMAINTAKGLCREHLSIILTPGGLILNEAACYGITTKCFRNQRDLANYLKSYLAKYQKLVFVTTSVSQSILILLCNLFYRRQIVHLHIVHGGTEEHLSYGRKSLLNNLPVSSIAVSNYVRERLEANGVRLQKIKVIENFLLESEIEKIQKRKPFQEAGIVRVIVVSRLDPVKRLDLIFDALDFSSQLDGLEFRIFGFGSDMEKLKRKASESYPQVIIKGFSNEVFKAMANSDLLLHLCPVEPFGLAILEAMAVGLPVLVPDRGGAKALVQHGVSGFKFKANNEKDLALCLLKLRHASPELLNYIVKNAQKTLKNKFSERQGIDAYLKLINSS